MFTASGLRVRFLRVYEKSGYKPDMFVAVDVDVPLTSVGAVLVALVLEDDAPTTQQQVDAPDASAADRDHRVDLGSGSPVSTRHSRRRVS